VQLLFVKKVKVTEPVGVPAPVPETVAWSVTVEPAGAEVTVWPLSCTDVVTWLGALFTVNGSHAPVEVR
jgi:hypothetical protein